MSKINHINHLLNSTHLFKSIKYHNFHFTRLNNNKREIKYLKKNSNTKIAKTKHISKILTERTVPIKLKRNKIKIMSKRPIRFIHR